MPSNLRNIWRGIKARCYNKHSSRYAGYGGRGVRMHEAWREDFEQFREDVEREIGPPPDGHTLDRIDNEDGHYEPGNIKWSTPKQQANNLRTNVKLTIDGETKTASQWADETGMRRDIITRRIQLGWTDKDAVFVPARSPNPGRLKKLTINNETKSLSEWGKQAGISQEVINHRLKRGWPPEEAVFAPLNPENPRTAKLWTVFGRTQTLPKWAKEFGLKPSAVYGRLNRGWSIERALTTPKDD